MDLHVVGFILCWIQAASKGTLTDKKCQQMLIIDLITWGRMEEIGLDLFTKL
jgi:hypothetical protein